MIHNNQPIFFSFISLKLLPLPCAVLLASVSTFVDQELNDRYCCDDFSELSKCWARKPYRWVKFNSCKRFYPTFWDFGSSTALSGYCSRLTSICPSLQSGAFGTHVWPFWTRPFDAVNESRACRPRWLACGDAGALRSFVLGSAKIIHQVQVTLEISGSSPLQMSTEDLFGWEERNTTCTTLVWIFSNLSLLLQSFVSVLVEIAHVGRNTGWSAVQHPKASLKLGFATSKRKDSAHLGKLINVRGKAEKRRFGLCTWKMVSESSHILPGRSAARWEMFRDVPRCSLFKESWFFWTLSNYTVTFWKVKLTSTPEAW